MDAILTKYLGPRGATGSRLKAKLGNDTVTIAYDSALTAEANHAFAAKLVARKAKRAPHEYVQQHLGVGGWGYAFVVSDYDGNKVTL